MENLKMNKFKLILKDIFGFLTEDSIKSSMRLGFLLTTFGGFWVLLRLANYIDIFAKKGIELTQWDGMAIFAISIGSVITGVAWMKTKQKKLEKDSDK